MADLMTASINVSKIDKSKLVQGKQGLYLNLTIWKNDEPNQFGNDVSIQQSLTKEEREAGAPKIFLGNGKTVTKGDGNKPAAPSEASKDGLPF